MPLGRSFTVPLLLYLTSLVLPYLFGLPAIIAIEAWAQSAQARFIARATRRLYGDVALWSHEEERRRRMALLAKEGPNALAGFTGYSYDLLASSLNALGCLLVVSAVTDPVFLIAYAASVVAGVVLLRLQRTASHRHSASAEEARVRLSGSLLIAWDNVALGNEHNFRRWERGVDDGLRRLRTAALRSVRYSQLIALGASMTTLLPTFVALYATLRGTPSTATVLGVVVALPRIFQILNSTHHVLSLVSGWSAQRGKLEVLAGLFSASPPGDLAARVSLSRLRLYRRQKREAPFHSVDGLVAHVAGGAAGRFRLSGANGAGKSTLLLLLKAKLGDGAFLLPARHELCFGDGTAVPPGRSTGERLLEYVAEIGREVSARVLLLDEWDANLDAENRRRISAALDALVERGIAIVEISHRADDDRDESPAKEGSVNAR